MIRCSSAIGRLSRIRITDPSSILVQDTGYRYQSFKNHAELCKLLIKAKADVEVKDKVRNIRLWDIDLDNM